MNNEQESELERQMFKLVEDAGCGDQGEVFIGTLNLAELDLTKLKEAVVELERMKGEFGPDAHDFLDTEIEVFSELIEKVERAV